MSRHAGKGDDAVRAGSAVQAGPGRYVVVCDRDGRRTAVARCAVSAVGEAEDGGAVRYLLGGPVICAEADLDVVLGWLA